MESLQPNIQPPSGDVNGWYKATVLRRFFALFIDGLIFTPIVLVLALSLAKQLGGLVWFMIYFLGPILGVFFIWRFGATPGKMLLKIRVVNTEYKPVSFLQVLLRETIGKFLSGLVWNLGYLWALWDKDKQTWHDKIAKTYVVTKLPNSGKESVLKFIVISALSSILIIGILAAGVIVVINPMEQIKKGRDATRLNDLLALQQAISVEIENSSQSGKLLCAGGNSPCQGKSDSAELNIRNKDGSGWVKINLSKNTLLGPVLPVDPLNADPFYYRYCSDGANWEIDASLESKQMQSKAVADGGDNSKLYEVGSDLHVCK